MKAVVERLLEMIVNRVLVHIREFRSQLTVNTYRSMNHFFATSPFAHYFCLTFSFFSFSFFFFFFFSFSFPSSLFEDFSTFDMLDDGWLWE